MVAGFGVMLGYSLKESEHYFIFQLSYLSILLLIAFYFIYTVIIIRTGYSMVVFDMINLSYGKGNISADNMPYGFTAKRKMLLSDLDSIKYSFDGHQNFFTPLCSWIKKLQ
jgi:hypothetical protein